MKFKEFKKWCNDRCFDGCWGKNEAMECLMALDYMKIIPFWKALTILLGKLEVSA
jgi:hypothetical protein